MGFLNTGLSEGSLPATNLKSSLNQFIIPIKKQCKDIYEQSVYDKLLAPVVASIMAHRRCDTCVVSSCVLYPLCVLYVFKNVGNNIKRGKIKMT